MFWPKNGKVGIFILVCLLFNINLIYFGALQIWEYFPVNFPYYHIRSNAFSQNLNFQSAKKPNTPLLCRAENTDMNKVALLELKKKVKSGKLKIIIYIGGPCDLRKFLSANLLDHIGKMTIFQIKMNFFLQIQN